MILHIHSNLLIKFPASCKNASNPTAQEAFVQIKKTYEALNKSTKIHEVSGSLSIRFLF